MPLAQAREQRWPREIRLDRAAGFEDIASANRTRTMSSLSKDRKVVWIHVLTVMSAAILIGAEVFGAAFAGSWALSNLMGFGPTAALVLDIVFVLLGIVVMVQFIRAARKIEPFVTRG
jgi:hypothetical protein